MKEKNKIEIEGFIDRSKGLVLGEDGSRNRTSESGRRKEDARRATREVQRKNY